MYYFTNGIRIVQSRNSKQNYEYIVTGEELNERVFINISGFNIINKFIKLVNKQKPYTKFMLKYKDFFNFLIESKIMKEYKDMPSNIFFISSKTPSLPLSSLNLEITDGCNLKCIHCYDDFGNKKIQFMDKNNIFSLINDLNQLNTFSVAITGGESTIHPDFIEIATFFIKNGFELTVFTNGLKYEKIIELLELFPNKKIKIKISLDGFEQDHNHIRRNPLSFFNCIKLLDLLKKYSNCIVYVSSIIMKSNIDRASEFKKFMEKEYPMYKYAANLITPCPTNTEHCFKIDEFDDVYKKYKNVFEIEKNKDRKKNRCSGGISQCTIMVDGFVKICNGAVGDIFKFKHNVFKEGLVKTWLDCGDNIKIFRNEKRKNTLQCKKCAYKRKCYGTDCRIISEAYFGNTNFPNPIICYSAKRGVSK